MIDAPPLFKTLLPLFCIQFLSWAGMFCMWIYAVPVIAGDVFHGDASPAQYGRALAAIGGCYALYAILGASLAFVLPKALERSSVRVVYGFALAISACGIAALGVIAQGFWLVPAFVAIGVGWCCMSNIPYAIVSEVAPEGKGAHLMRVFAFSTVAPQVTMTLLLAFAGPRLTSETTHFTMLVGGCLMGGAAALTLALGGRFQISTQDW
jgi:maltose/moltooligosaccharide transporter